MTFSFSMKVSTREFDTYTKEAQEKAKKAVKKSAFAIQADAAQNAPVDTGALKNSISALPKDEKTWTVEDGMDYGVYQELGTSKVSARHFLGNAAEKQADKFFDDVKEALQ